MSLYGTYVADSNNQSRYVYVNAQTGKLVSVNHVTHDPNASSNYLQSQNTKHSDYVELGRYVGPDTPRTFKMLERSKSKAKYESEAKAKYDTKRRTLPKSVRRA